MAKKSMNGQSQSTISEMSTSGEDKRMQVYAKYKSIYDLFVISGEIVNFSPDKQMELLMTYRIDFPHYSYNMNCQACVAEFLSKAYRHYSTL